MAKLGTIAAMLILGAGLWLLPIQKPAKPEGAGERLRDWGLFLVGGEERSTSTYCRQCGTGQRVLEYRLGPYQRRLAPEERPSLVFRELLDANHEHQWELDCVNVRSAAEQSLG